MKSKQIILSAVAAVFAAAAVGHTSAKIPQWSIDPRYLAIKHYDNRTYKVRDTGKQWQLMTATGDIVCDPNFPAALQWKYDSIMPIVNGYGLLLNFDLSKKAYKITGIYNSSNGKVKGISSSKYYVDEYPFFSEGKIPVRKDNKKYGYIDTLGREISKFDYTVAYPYREGVASVGKGKTSFSDMFKVVIGNKGDSKKDNTAQNCRYLGEDGKEIVPPAAAGKSFILCTTFNDGMAVVTNEKGESYMINSSFAPTKQVSSNDISLDEMHSYVGVVGTLDYPKPDKIVLNEDEDISIRKEGDRYGYYSEGEMIVPVQFLSSEPFVDGYAIATTDFNTGLLTLSDEDIDVDVEGEPKENGGGFDMTLTYTLPESLLPLAQKLLFKVKLPDGSEITPTHRLNERQIIYESPEGTQTLTILGRDQLVLFQKSFSQEKQDKEEEEEDTNRGKTVRKQSGVSIGISPASVTANKSRAAAINVTVRNVSDTKKTLTVKISGQNLSGGTHKITLAPGKSKTFSPVFVKIVRNEKRLVTVTAGGKTVSKSVTVKPPVIKL